MPQRSILFVCLGNICRSPTAEALFRHFVKEKGLADEWIIDSAALIDLWVGNPADERTLRVLEKHDIVSHHVVRTVTPEDFVTFDYIVGMDESNMRELRDMKPQNAKCQLFMLGQYDPENHRTVKDPYYGHEAGFDTMYDHCYRCCRTLLDSL